jgi:hypothetical protein
MLIGIWASKTQQQNNYEMKMYMYKKSEVPTEAQNVLSIKSQYQPA